MPAALFLLLVAFAAPAQAETTLFGSGVRYPVAGPILAGDRVAWVTRADAELEVHTAALDGSARSVRAIEAPVASSGAAAFVRFAASDRRVAAGVYVRYCALPCKYQYYEPTYRATLSAPLGEQPVRLEEECRPRVDESPSVDVWEDVVAYRDACAARTVVRDFSPGAGDPAVLELPAGQLVRIAGAYVAVREGPPSGEAGDSALVVRDRRTGAERLRIPEKVESFDLQPDGKVAFVRRRAGGSDLMWASPEQQQPRMVVQGEEGPVQRLVDDNAVVGARSTLAVVRLDGYLVFSGGRDAVDFDGTRLLGVINPCAVVGIATWELGEDPPTMPDGRCPLPGSRRSVLRADLDRGRYGTTAALLACTDRPALGCRGRVSLTARDARPGRSGWIDVATGTYALLPGETAEVRLDFTKRGICATGRSALRPVLQVFSRGRGELGLESHKKRRVRLAGIKRAMAACD